MSVTLRPARGGKGFEYSIVFNWPEGGWFRERRNAPPKGKDAARRWAEARERALLTAGKAALIPAPRVEGPPTLDAFWPRVVSDHYEANRKKPSTIDAAKTIYRVHLASALGACPLDVISTSHVATLKGKLASKARKTVNNILAVLSRVLSCAVEWGVIPAMPCKLGFFKVDNAKMRFYERAEYLRLVESTWSPASRVLVLLAGSAGLRRGEIIALRWSHIDLTRRAVRVQMNVWRKLEGTPKGGRHRDVPLTAELASALEAHRRGGRAVVSIDDHVLPDLTPRRVRNWIARAERRAGLVVGTAREAREGGGIHVLRHTFCSHLSMAGVPAKAIQELAGHADLATTQRYMHLSPANRSTAMAALEAFHAEPVRTPTRSTARTG